MKVLLIPFDGTIEALDIPNTLEAMQDIVDGDIEMVYGGPDGDFVMWFNAEGKFEGQPPNEVATQLLIEAGGIPGDHIAGNAFLSGPNDGDDVPASVLERFKVSA